MLDSSPEDEDFPGRLLHQAALWDNIHLLIDLLENGQQIFINSQDSWGRTALHAAAVNENSGCLQMLLDAGADPNLTCGPRGDNKTPLHLCAEHGHSGNISILLEHGADISLRDAKGRTATDLAEKNGHTKCVTVLKEAEGAREKARVDLHSKIREACCEGDVTLVTSLFDSLSKDAELIVNMAPSGANTLLYIACQNGNKDIVRILLEHGADGRYHPVTRYSPLYIACHYGHRDIVEMLLLRFPELVQQHTVERWLPIHAAAINGHVTVLELLFQFPYPAHVMRKFRDSKDQYEYFMPFDINERDATGQNILYMASLVGNKKLLDVILKFRVKGTKIEANGEKASSSENPAPSPSRRKHISDGIQSIMHRLSLSRSSSMDVSAFEPDTNNALISPVRIDMYCNNNCETALHVAIKGKHYDIVLSLLNAGANPNSVIKSYPDIENSSCCAIEEDSYYSTGLVEACQNRDVPVVDLLLKYGARDDDSKALQVAVRNKDETLIAKLLSIKAHPDPEYKINKKQMTENLNNSTSSSSSTSSKFSLLFPNLTSLTYSTLFPTTPVMINWHNQKCHNLTQIRTEWLTDASLHLNPRLKQNPKSYDLALYAITRLDISNNNLTGVPLTVFQLFSLKYLNLSQNKIERLPVAAEETSSKSGRQKLTGNSATTNASKNKNKTPSSKMPQQKKYTCPLLEELYLQDNRLDHIPAAIFELSNLVTLNVSNNKLQELPYNMWSAPKLKELNASFNLLKELPAANQPPQEVKDSCDRISISSSDSQSSLCSSSQDNPKFTCHSSASSTDLAELVDSGKFSVGSSGGTDEPPQSVRYQKRERPLMQFELSKHHIWTKSVEVTEQILHQDESTSEQSSQLSSLNLAHNLFTSIPCVLPCLAVNLTRLNMAFNSLRSMSHVTGYPNSLKQLDLSHNQITCWPSLPQIETQDSMELANITCYGSGGSGGGGFTAPGAGIGGSSGASNVGGSKDKMAAVTAVRRQSSRSVRSTVLHSVCSHRRHLRLDNLRTLILSDNQFTRIQLATDDDGGGIIEEEDYEKNPSTAKSRLIFPNLSMLDISNNDLKEIPMNIHELSNLSVLNISGNLDVTDLPPQMGLLSRLWNLNTRGCSLQDPLKSMIESKKYKTMDIIGYLKSVLEDARPYARMKLMIVGVQGIGKTSLLEQLRQEGITRKRPEHWAKRMGNKNINVKTSRGTNMSTVGVDIGDWIYEKKIRNQSSHGPVMFRTWDFGGQKEYYATHQYFLSKRSLYLVVWKIPDGYRGINEILQWLVNIQARAPNSPCIIVGTHYDVVQEINQPNISEEYQQVIRDRFINIVDAEKCGLPRVLDTIEISCKTRHNIKLLCNIVYDSVFSLKPPGSKELLLEQKVPATYLCLEDVVNHIAAERRINNLDPVLTTDQYRTIVTVEMQQRFNRTFRDWAELHQATLFLHDNGVLLHYDDATLKDLYFLDPQWLCDMLAHVVTIREINPFARTGVMKLDDLKHVFKSSNLGPIIDTTRSYIVNLLNKFEVALTWDSRTLLIPSLLPTEDEMLSLSKNPNSAMLVKIKVPLRSRGWAVRNNCNSKNKITISPKSVLFKEQQQQQKQLEGGASFQLSLQQKSPSATPTLNDGDDHPQSPKYEITSCPTGKSITRLLLMSYFPSGFWSRLISRILADDSIIDIIRSFFVLPKEVAQDPELAKLLDFKAEWILWQTGLQLKYGDLTLFRMKEILPNSASHYRQLKFRLKQDGVWCDVDMQNASILEIHFPVESLVIKSLTNFPQKEYSNNSAQDLNDRNFVWKNGLTVNCTVESTSQLLALAVDHVDILLEDWYPTLGTRFVHTSEGKFLVTRLVPCPQCLNQAGGDFLGESSVGNFGGDFGHPSRPFMDQGTSRQDHDTDHHGIPSRDENVNSFHGNNNRSIRESQESYTSECDSGVGHDSPSSSRLPSAEGHPHLQVDEQHFSNNPVFYSWMVEECILAAYGPAKCVICPVHSDVSLARIAPDTIFLDLGDRHIIKPDNIKKGKLLGRGAFGFVFKGTLVCSKSRGSGTITMTTMKNNNQQQQQMTSEVAMKMLQPVQPSPNARPSALSAYKAAQSKWDRDPLQYACKAYCTARQELNILLSLKHPNIVPFVGLCTCPLALVLDLAPQGALDLVLRHYRRSGARVCSYTLQSIILQAAKAIEYLHRQHIIYRDLKSENVLVWEMPPPFVAVDRNPADHPVHIKLADYGISRLTLPSGTKGFGGTEGFMAPEIMRYNGEEEYTEKVDCFSFGMFIYELLTLHQPFEGHESVKECILEGGRPALTYRETLYPSYFLDLMVLCWSQQPKDRPSASQIVSIASAPEFTHLSDVVSLKHDASVCASTCTALSYITDLGDEDNLCGSEIWVMCANSRIDMLLAADRGWLQYHSTNLPIKATCACNISATGTIWIGDMSGNIHAYSASDGRKMFTYRLETEPNVQINSLLTLPRSNRVACALSNGRLFLVNSEASPATPTCAEGTFVMTELGSAKSVVNCMCAVVVKETDTCELWCGENQGQISIYSLKTDHHVAGHELLNHFRPTIEQANVANLTADTDIDIDGSGGHVWSYVKPGCTVYQWDPLSRTVINKLDCSKLVPCSESLKSISIEEHLSPTSCQVTAMSVLNQELYIGTAWGCIIIAETSTLRPITIFRPYEEEVNAIIPLKIFHQNQNLNLNVQQTSENSNNNYNTNNNNNFNNSNNTATTNNNNSPLIATVGKGYRNLLSRYTDVIFNPHHHASGSLATATSPGNFQPPYLFTPGGGVARQQNNTFVLLWRAENWNPV